jgi:hypothetical protein
MTNNTGKKKQHRKKFQHLSKSGARSYRKDFIETEYVNGVVDAWGNQVMRPLTEEEKLFLAKFYKEEVHGTFTTDKESTALFRKAKSLSLLPENVKVFEETGKHSSEVEEAVQAFNEKSKSLGNTVYDFWQQREINSDSYKRRQDIHNNSILNVQLESFEDMQYRSEMYSEDSEDTTIEDLITESEE